MILGTSKGVIKISWLTFLKTSTLFNGSVSRVMSASFLGFDEKNKQIMTLDPSSVNHHFVTYSGKESAPRVFSGVDADLM